MNQLSWLLYWADVLPHLAVVVCVVSVIGIIISGIFTLFFLTQGFGEWTHDPDYCNRFRLFPYLVGLFVFLAVVSNIVPSKGTFYLIAASEAGEQALKTPEVSKVRAVINKWLDDAAAPDDKDDKK